MYAVPDYSGISESPTTTQTTTESKHTYVATYCMK